MTHRILVVDDEPAVTDLLAYNLRKTHYDVIVTADGDEALRLARESSPDLILLDLMIPNVDGLDVCRELRKTSGGTIILAAACPEGSGSHYYEDWALGKSSYDEVIQKFRAEGFRNGPHKAFQIARDASKIRLMFCSEMDEILARALLLNPVKDLQTAVNKALADLQPGERIGVLPHAASTIPYQDNSRGVL